MYNGEKENKMTREELAKKIESILEDTSGGTRNSQEWWDDTDWRGNPITPIIDYTIELILLTVDEYVKEFSN